jgi:F-type H+-transporting ATPase subunit b
VNINASLFIQWIPFLILAWFTAKFIWPPITKALDERAQKVAEGLAAADRAKADLAAANKRVEEQLVATRDEASRRLQDAERLAQQIVEDAKARANAEGARILAAAKADAEQMVLSARDSLRDEVAALAVKGAEQVLRREVDAKVHAELLARLKTEL